MSHSRDQLLVLFENELHTRIDRIKMEVKNTKPQVETLLNKLKTDITGEKHLRVLLKVSNFLRETFSEIDLVIPSEIENKLLQMKMDAAAEKEALRLEEEVNEENTEQPGSKWVRAQPEEIKFAETLRKKVTERIGNKPQKQPSVLEKLRRFLKRKDQEKIDLIGREDNKEGSRLMEMRDLGPEEREKEKDETKFIDQYQKVREEILSLQGLIRQIEEMIEELRKGLQDQTIVFKESREKLLEELSLQIPPISNQLTTLDKATAEKVEDADYDSIFTELNNIRQSVISANTKFEKMGILVRLEKELPEHLNEFEANLIGKKRALSSISDEIKELNAEFESANLTGRKDKLLKSINEWQSSVKYDEREYHNLIKNPTSEKFDTFKKHNEDKLKKLEDKLEQYTREKNHLLRDLYKKSRDTDLQIVENGRKDLQKADNKLDEWIISLTEFKKEMDELGDDNFETTNLKKEAERLTGLLVDWLQDLQTSKVDFRKKFDIFNENPTPETLKEFKKYIATDELSKEMAKLKKDKTNFINDYKKLKSVAEDAKLIHDDLERRINIISERVKKLSEDRNLPKGINPTFKAETDKLSNGILHAQAECEKFTTKNIKALEISDPKKRYNALKELSAQLEPLEHEPERLSNRCENLKKLKKLDLPEIPEISDFEYNLLLVEKPLPEGSLKSTSIITQNPPGFYQYDKNGKATQILNEKELKETIGKLEFRDLSLVKKPGDKIPKQLPKLKLYPTINDYLTKDLKGTQKPLKKALGPENLYTLDKLIKAKGGHPHLNWDKSYVINMLSNGSFEARINHFKERFLKEQDVEKLPKIEIENTKKTCTQMWQLLTAYKNYLMEQEHLDHFQEKHINKLEICLKGLRPLLQGKTGLDLVQKTTKIAVHGDFEEIKPEIGGTLDDAIKKFLIKYGMEADETGKFIDFARIVQKNQYNNISKTDAFLDKARGTMMTLGKPPAALFALATVQKMQGGDFVSRFHANAPCPLKRSEINGISLPHNFILQWAMNQLENHIAANPFSRSPIYIEGNYYKTFGDNASEYVEALRICGKYLEARGRNITVHYDDNLVIDSVGSKPHEIPPKELNEKLGALEARILETGGTGKYFQNQYNELKSLQNNNFQPIKLHEEELSKPQPSLLQRLFKGHA